MLDVKEFLYEALRNKSGIFSKSKTAAKLKIPVNELEKILKELKTEKKLKIYDYKSLLLNFKAQTGDEQAQKVIANQDLFMVKAEK